MTESFHQKFNQNVIHIFPGEYHIISSSEIISTLLGSCVAVVLYDPIKRVGGMNHFMLPEAVNPDTFYLSSAGKYGMYAMELLINGLIKAGADKRSLRAKVFGGSSMFGEGLQAAGSIPESNTQLAFNFLKLEHIPVVSSDVGGVQARRLFFLLDTFKVYVKKIEKNIVKTMKDEELSYLEKMNRNRVNDSSTITLYE